MTEAFSTSKREEVIAGLRKTIDGNNDEIRRMMTKASEPLKLLLWCPACHARHIDEGKYATLPHRTHACQACGLVWKPSLSYTVGVAFLDGGKDGCS